MRNQTLAILAALSASSVLIAACSSDSDTKPADQTDASVDSSQESTPDLQVTATVTSPRNIRLTWPSVTGKDVVIERATADSENFQEVARKSNGQSRFLDLALTPSTAYHYRVKVCEGTVCGVPFLTDALTTTQSPVPANTVTVPYAGGNNDVMVLGIATLLQNYLATGYTIGIDREGTILWEYQSAGGIVSEVEQLPDNKLAVIQLVSFEQLDLDGTVTAKYSSRMVHHDVDRLPDGRFALLYWDQVKEDSLTYLGDGIEILSADLKSQWTWKTSDHIPATDVCSLCIKEKLFTFGQDWTHSNAITFDNDNQKIYLNVRNLNRLYKIDYPTGNIEWIMGDGGDFGAGIWSHAHDPHILPNNHVLILDNGYHRAGGEQYSRVLNVVYDPSAKTASIAWEYRETPDFYSYGVGSVFPQDNGNILLTDGANGRLVDITPDKQKAWELYLGKGWGTYKAIVVPRTMFTDW
jgi:hypothetical protein